MGRPAGWIAGAMVVAFLGAWPFGSTAGAEEHVITAHAFAMHGEPQYGPDFPHFDYVNPEAPKGGRLNLSAFGGFDNLNGFILRGTAAAGLGFLYETLAESSSDEAFTEYGLLAETISMPENRGWVEFRLRPEARWHDGRPLTAEDVVWTFETLTTKGHPFFRSYYAEVERAIALDDHTVRFEFARAGNRELPLIMGQLTILPKHYWEGRDFEATTLDPPIGSGPYRIAQFDAGRSITFERVEDWWGADLPINRGRYNFDRIVFDYYRDAEVMFEAFKAGQFDFRLENTAKNWATGYDIPAVRTGDIVKVQIANEDPQGMQGFVLNTRREFFTDSRVRRAINYLIDFEWMNKNLFYDQYVRSDSYFSNTELASRGLPEGEELDILSRFRGRVPEEVFTEPFVLPATDGSGNIRGNLRQALRLLGEAGWEIRDGVLRNAATGKPFEFEIMLVDSNFERLVQPFARNLERAGIEVTIRVVDSSQFQNRVDGFDFDVIVSSFGQSLSPGNEQLDYWGSSKADVSGSRNLAGIQDPVIDELIDLIIIAPDRDSLIQRTRALDRVLLWGYYIVPHWHIASYRVAYRNSLRRPDQSPRYGLPYTTTWWIDPAFHAASDAGR